MINEKKVKALYKKAAQDPKHLIFLSAKLLSGLSQEVKQERAACKSGCIHCCYLRVDAYGFEVDSIIYHISTEMNSKTRGLVKEAIKQQYNLIKKLTIEQHHHINVQCPLLINEKCSAYPVRPVACASYHSMSENPCKRSYDNPYDTSIGIPQSHRVESLKLQTHSFIQTELKSGSPKELISQLFLHISGEQERPR
ncbi:YkgJ family cysteine cluster protein [Acerihabitans sp. TG2]|uniref:YkgJ family cysteine cluster protein n=1 Tax=Acerihabitans sp. TG2 TaxID=3096008 RepID=UPI002B224879|nr:YkgJ family cysteine cluster protein [Acerihabitans sp. TG2]MEA9392647.1 YkgJ family cysteine cluster protein [Acerihabitans sp. TG2]